MKLDINNNENWKIHKIVEINILLDNESKKRSQKKLENT